MKNLFKILIVIIAFSFVISCNKDDDNTPSEEAFKPRCFISNFNSNRLIVYDTRNTANLKQNIFNWSNTTHLFEFDDVVDTTTNSGGGTSLYYISKNWPIGVTDAVNTGYYYVHVQDRSVNNTTYIVSATDNPIYRLDTSTMTDDHTNIPTAWTQAGVVDGYVITYERYNTTTYTVSRIFFDLNNNKYLILRNNSNVENGDISDFVKAPLGDTIAHNIDFTLADAVFYLENEEDDRYPNEMSIYFLDYETKQYVLVTRKVNSILAAGKNTLRTTSWQPMSNLFDSWPFD